MLNIIKRIFEARTTILLVVVFISIGLMLYSDYSRWTSFNERMDGLDSKIAQAQIANEIANTLNEQASETRQGTLAFLTALTHLTQTAADLLNARPVRVKRTTQRSPIVLCTRKPQVQEFGDYYVSYRDLIPLENCKKLRSQ